MKVFQNALNVRLVLSISIFRFYVTEAFCVPSHLNVCLCVCAQCAALTPSSIKQCAHRRIGLFFICSSLICVYVTVSV